MAFANDNYNRNRNVNGYTDTGTGYKPTTIKTPTNTYVQPHNSSNVYVGENRDGYVYYGGNSNNGNTNGRNTRSTTTTSAPSGPSSDYSYQDDTLNKIKSLLEEQKAKADAYYKTLYEQQLAQNRQDWENNRNQANLNFMRTNRYLNQLYGGFYGNAGFGDRKSDANIYGTNYNGVSGTGLSNRMRNYSNWNNYLANNNTARTNNDASALAQYNSNLSNTASTLAQGWYNYVMPIYTNRQTNADDYSYRRYLASLG